MAVDFGNINEVTKGNRLHIGIFGRRNAGKSSLINALTGQELAIVSEELGTTTDPVSKSMEISPIGPCVIIDTAGFDDDGAVGSKRVDKSREVIGKTDVGIILIPYERGQNKLDLQNEIKWIDLFKQNKTSYLVIINKFTKKEPNLSEDFLETVDTVDKTLMVKSIVTNIKADFDKNVIVDEIIRLMPSEYEEIGLTSHLVSPEDTVLLVMPQDKSAPKGRLILPQVQTIRDLLDNGCVVTSVTFDKMKVALANMKTPPKYIITDSQVFKEVYDLKPEESVLTSFSVLFARYKGDVGVFVKGALAIDTLTRSSKILIAEACTHAPLSEDIGRVKIPAMLRKKVGDELRVDVVAGVDFPEELGEYDLVIHCGGCMFNRKHILTRIEKCKTANVPITNYGIAVSKLTGILDQISIY